VISPCMSESVPLELRKELSQCGIDSLYSCIRYLGIDVRLDQMYDDIQQDENNEVNLHQLRDYASRFGVAVKPVEHPTLRVVRKYLASNSCAVLQFEYPDRRPHMTALFCPEDEGILVCDYPRKKYVISESKLADYLNHSRGMLILSRTALQESIFSQLARSRLFWSGLLIIASGALAATAWAATKRKNRNRAV
jgi:ABC-type bacteriocin/lantibiotic exporter with double-glycine peptidase domain